MSKRGFYQRYSLIIKRLQKSPASFEEINDYLEQQSEFQDFDLKFSIRQFQRDIKDIRELFGLEIQYSRLQKAYFIDNANQSTATDRMLEYFYMVNALNVTDDLSKHIHLEQRRAQGTEHFYGLLHCIKNHFIVRFPYHKYEDDIIVKREVEPYALKEFKGRWYLIAKDVHDDYTKTFGLDRIQDLEITKKKFTTSPEFNANNLFKDYFGIINSSDNELTEIVLSFDSFQGKYVKSFPLHESQKVILDNENETRIKLSLYVTYDFLLELLSFGDRMKVLSPDSLQKEVCETYNNALKQYKK